MEEAHWTTYQNRPEVDDNEQEEIEFAVEGEQEDEDVVREGLEVSVEWVEGMRCEWGGY